MRLVNLMAALLFYGVFSALLSLIFTVIVFDLPSEQILGWAVFAALWGAICGVLIDRRRKTSLWLLIVDGVLAAF